MFHLLYVDEYNQRHIWHAILMTLIFLPPMHVSRITVADLATTPLDPVDGVLYYAHEPSQATITALYTTVCPSIIVLINVDNRIPILQSIPVHLRGLALMAPFDLPELMYRIQVAFFHRTISVPWQPSTGAEH